MAEKPDQLFETMLKEAGVPITEAAMKAEWDACLLYTSDAADEL